MENEGKENNENPSTEGVEQSTKKAKKYDALKIIKITWSIVEKILIIAIIFVSAVIMVQRVSNNEKAFFGYRIFRVQTGSMIPKYQIGDVILVKEKTLDKIAVGDDVTYTSKVGVMNGKQVTHQVIAIEEVDGQKVFHTKGIANNLEDPEIYGGQINGVVQCKLYILTWICTLLTNPYAFYFIRNYTINNNHILGFYEE